MFLRSFAFYTIVICNKNSIRQIGCITFHVTEANVVKALWLHEHERKNIIDQEIILYQD